MAPGPADQAIGTGDGTNKVFSLCKIYGAVVRPISKPVSGTVRVAVDGVEVTDFTVDTVTGQVTLTSARHL